MIHCFFFFFLESPPSRFRNAELPFSSTRSPYKDSSLVGPSPHFCRVNHFLHDSVGCCNSIKRYSTSPYMPPKVGAISSGLKVTPDVLRAQWEMCKLIFFFLKKIFKRRQDPPSCCPWLLCHNPTKCQLHQD